MKKILSVVLVAMLSLALLVSLVGCFPGSQPQKTGLERAQEYLNQIMNNKSANTAADYSDLLTNVVIDKENYPVSWAVTAEDGSAIDTITATVGEDGKVTIDVPDRATEAINYVLVATISDAKGNTLTSSYNRTVPQFKVFTWAEFTSAADDTAVAIDGIITGIVNTSTKHELYLQDNDGGYYVYNLPADEMTDLAIGMEILVLGNRDTYYGVNQVIDASVEIINATPNYVTAKDITTLYNEATTLQADNLKALQSQLIKIEGVVIAGIDPSNDTYYSFTKVDGTNKTYVRISGSACMFGTEDQNAFKTTFNANVGMSATVEGIVSIYNNQIYILPVTKDAYSNFAIVDRDAQGKADWELKQVTAPGTITEGGKVTLNTTPLVYTDVTVAWALKETYDFATIADNKLNIPVLPAEATTITLTATVTCGDKTATKDFQVTVNAAPTVVPEIVDVPVAGTAYKFFLKQLNTKQTLYFTGDMDGYYFAATTDPSKAVDVAIELVEGSETEYYFYWINPTSGSKNYISVTLAGGKFTLTTGRLGVDTTKFTYDTTTKTLFTTVTGTDKEGAESTRTIYFGTFNTNTTFSASDTYRITGDSASALDNTQFVAHFGVLVDNVPGDPSDEPCTEHVDADNNGICDNCEATVTTPEPDTNYTAVTELKNGDVVIIVADAYKKALSVTKTGNYNVGVDYADGFGNITDAELFIVTVNADGSYSFTSKTGKALAMAAEYTSLNDTGVNNTWTLEAVSGKTGVFYVKNNGRGTYLEWYSKYSNWSTYSANTDNQFEISFLLVESGATAPEICTHTNTTTTTVDATCTAEGSSTVTCDDCNATISTTTLPLADHNYVDGTCACGATKVSGTITASKTVAELITEYGWTNSTTKQSFKLDDNVSVKINGGSNTGKAYDGNNIRIYATDTPAGTITISVPEGYELVSIKITTQTGTYAFLYVGEGTTDICNQTVEVSGNSVILNSVRNGDNGKQVRVTAIEVVYESVA